jgi:hypothetical protein
VQRREPHGNKRNLPKSGLHGVGRIDDGVGSGNGAGLGVRWGKKRNLPCFKGDDKGDHKKIAS